MERKLPKKISQDVYWVGAVDWNIRNFHGYTYTTKRGTTYNAYLIIDEKVALVDTVLGSFAGELIERIKQIIAPEKIDYIIANHVESDHSGALPEVMRLCPKAKIFGSAKCKEGLHKHYYRDWDFQVVKSGDKLKLGKKTLSFIEAPMLHWPDSMFTYLIEEALLMPNDAFGQHYASGERFDDEVEDSVLIDEAAKYYGNILWPFSPLILKKIDEIKKLNIPLKMIAPSHGIIWRSQPMKIVTSYLRWANNETRPKAIIVYETMWGATEKMARKIAEGIIDSGVSLRLFDINRSERTEIIKEMLDAKGYLIGSSTHDMGMLSNIAGFLEFLKGLKPKGRISATFGSYGWSGGAVESIEESLKRTGVEIAQPPLSVKFAPNEEEIQRCYEFGRGFAAKIGG